MSKKMEGAATSPKGGSAGILAAAMASQSIRVPVMSYAYLLLGITEKLPPPPNFL